jgi:hypothetical protein
MYDYQRRLSIIEAMIHDGTEREESAEEQRQRNNEEARNGREKGNRSFLVNF